jgi:hypothetical protein
LVSAIKLKKKFQKNEDVKMGSFPYFLVMFCFHAAKCSGVFLRIATVAAGVIMDLKIFDM